MMISVAANFHWPPDIIGGFFFDNEDSQGLEYWYEAAKELNSTKKKEEEPQPQ